MSMTPESQLWELDQPINDYDVFENIDGPPAWIDADFSPSDAMGVYRGGCASGAYVPAVTYADALETMNEHGDDVLDFLYAATTRYPTIHVDDSWAEYASRVLSSAVETWTALAVSEMTDALETHLGDEERRLRALFNEDVKPNVVAQYGADDEIALNEEFNNWIDMLQKDGEILEYVASNVTRED